MALSLGSDVMAVLGVVTGFFAGLALGALTLDRWLRHGARPRRAYAVLEIIIGGWALASIWLLPAAGRGLTEWLGPAPHPALLWAAGFALPALLLLPATAAMGGTLIVLERLTSALTRRARVAAGVYGANTAGAVGGALAGVYLLMPAFGLSGTLLAMAGVNLACASGALLLPAEAEATIPAPAAGPIGPGRLEVTLAATGLLGIALEVLVIRLAAQSMQDTIYTFALLLAAYLLGTAIGGLAWQMGRLVPTARAVAGLLACAALATFGTAVLIPLGPGLALPEPVLALLLFVPPAAVMGALFGCLLQAVRDRRGTLGQAVALNGLGAAMAAPLVALVLIPAAGAWPGLLVVAFGYLLLIPLRHARYAAVPAALGAALMFNAPPPPAPPGTRLLASIEGPAATASVAQDAAGNRYLHVNGHLRMGGTNSLRSDWRQALLPLALHHDPHSALFLGVGTGATLAGAAALPGLTATGVELLPQVVRLLPWFQQPGDFALPPIVTADARRFVASSTAQYDVIVADLFHPALDGSGSLYTAEHFAAIRARLAPGGVFCQWLPLYQLDTPSLHAIMRSFLRAYPDGSGWLAHYSLRTPMLALIGGNRPHGLDPAAIAARLDAPAFSRVGFATPLDVLGLYVGDARTIAAIAGPGPLNTDDRPFVTLDAARNVQALDAPAAGRLLALLHDPAAREAVSGATPLDAYRRARNRFIEAGAAIPDGLTGPALMQAAISGLLDSIRISAAFDPAYRPLLDIARALLAADRPAGLHLLHEIAAAAPGRVEARQMLARSNPP